MQKEPYCEEIYAGKAESLPREIPNEMKYLSGLGEELIMTLSELETRLQPVLQSETPQVEGNSKDSSAQTDLGNSIKRSNRILQSNIERLRSILNRLEL